jgi:hypothetical protein
MSRFLIAAAVLGLAGCARKDAEPSRADTAAVVVRPPADTTIKTDTVMVAGDTAKTD